MDHIKTYKKWINSPYTDDVIKQELVLIGEDKDEIEDRFYKNLDFGTAGMRGIIAAGTNRMNCYTVRKTTEGFARYITDNDGQKSGVIISYDSRNMSKEFAVQTALVMCAHGIKTYLFDDIHPVPMLSFGVRELQCFAGVMITASHNPKEYNGYKVYGGDGGQLEPEFAEILIGIINSLDIFTDIKAIKETDAREAGFLCDVPDIVDEQYYKNINALILDKNIFDKTNDDFSVVYTPIHGTGRVPVLRAFADAGISGVYCVTEQMEADGNFPTVPVPNPEDKNALKMAIELSKKCGADLCMATDPDCDRMGAAIKTTSGDFKILSGNQIGILMIDYILRTKKELGTLPENGAIIKTIVSTQMAKAVADDYGITTFDVLTGFKFIAGKIADFEETGDHEFLFAFEESIGFLEGSFVRDKDAVQACLIMAELGAYYKSLNKTPYEGLIELYERYGYYLEETISYYSEGIEGAQSITNIMNKMRENIPKNIGSIDVISFRDYLTQEEYNLKDTTTKPLDLPVSDVLYYELSGDCKFVVRPSGTEPKIKFYYGAKAANEADAKGILEGMKESIDDLLF